MIAETFMPRRGYMSVTNEACKSTLAPSGQNFCGGIIINGPSKMFSRSSGDEQNRAFKSGDLNEQRKSNEYTLVAGSWKLSFIPDG